MDVTLHGGEEDSPAAVPLGLEEGQQHADRALHHTGALDHLRQEHLSGPEEVADRIHAVHQRALDDIQWLGVGLSCLLGVGLDEPIDAMNEGVTDALFHRGLAP